MDTQISVDVDPVAAIIVLPKEGVDLEPFFACKDPDKSHVAQMKEKDNLTQDKRGFDIAFINDQGFKFASKLLSRKLIQNM